MSAAFPLRGHATPEARFLGAKESGRLHHAWILQGPSGIGKSIFAKRLAGLMLGAADTDAPADDKTMQLMLSGGHPDLKWVERGLNEKGKLRQDITVDQIRELNQFFALRPAMAGWRVGFVVGNRHIIQGLRTMKTNLDYGIFSALQKAAEAALQLPDK